MRPYADTELLLVTVSATLAFPALRAGWCKCALLAERADNVCFRY